MRIYISLLIIAFAIISCGKERKLSEELEGEWIYERELFIKDGFANIFEDVSGIIKLKIDNSGSWVSVNSKFAVFSRKLEWKLDSSEEKITIFRTLTLTTVFPHLDSGTREYNIKRTDENNFTFTYIDYSISEDSIIEVVEEFDNIILTRKP